MNDLQKAREFFKNDRYATEQTGIIIEEVGENYAKCSLKLDERHLNAVGHPMGGVMYTLADFVFAVSTNFNKECVTVTTVSQICYLGAPKGKVLYGESKLLKDGRTTCFYEVHITDELGTK
ncbi:MAG: PaaI family thioesterase, partial [Clostridia bacterium]|nr:PaaI family thioesterase [Clostridia bacterium]